MPPALFAAALLLLQSPDSARRRSVDRADLRDGLDTLYAGEFAAAAGYFARLSAGDTADPAPVVFHAGAYIWWAAARDSDDFEAPRIDSLLDVAITRARARPPGAEQDFWLATALGYRARERELHGHPWGAAKDAKAMRDAYRRVVAVDPSCVDCKLGLGLYSYGMARVSTLVKIVAKLIGLGSGNAEEGIALMHQVAAGGDLARIEGTWVLASALVREAERDKTHRDGLRAEAVALVEALARRYPGNPVFRHFLDRMAGLAP